MKWTITQRGIEPLPWHSLLLSRKNPSSQWGGGFISCSWVPFIASDKSSSTVSADETTETVRSKTEMNKSIVCLDYQPTQSQVKKKKEEQWKNIQIKTRLRNQAILFESNDSETVPCWPNNSKSDRNLDQCGSIQQCFSQCRLQIEQEK